MSILSSGPHPPRPRIHHLDFIRLVAMLLMIQGHTLDAFLDPAYMDLDTFHWQAWVQLRGLTAPLFLLVSGAATVLGVRHDLNGRIPLSLLRRRIITGCTVIALGYLMVFPANRLADLRWVSMDVWQGFLRVNILQLNGVTLLILTALLAMTRTVRRYAAWSLGLGFMILLLAPIVTSIDWFSIFPEGLAAYLSFDHGSLFPLFPTSAYMFLGVGLGALLMEVPADQRVRLFRLASLTASALLLLLAMGAEHLTMKMLPAHDLYKAGYAYSCFRLGFALLIIGMLAWVAEVQPRFAAVLASLGRKSLAVYVVHLTLIYGTPWTQGLARDNFHALSLGQGALFIPLVGGATFAAVLLWDSLRSHSSPVRTLTHVATTCGLAYALIF